MAFLFGAMCNSFYGNLFISGPLFDIFFSRFVVKYAFISKVLSLGTVV